MCLGEFHGEEIDAPINDNVILCLKSDDASTSSDEDDDRTIDTTTSRAAEQVSDVDLPPTAHGGHIFASEACSLQ